MSIQLSSNFLLSAQLPLDSRIIAVDSTARDAIPTVERYFGLVVILQSDGTAWMLANIAMGGSSNTLSDNANWIAFGVSPTADNVVFNESPGQTQSGSDVILTLAHIPTQVNVFWQGQLRDPNSPFSAYTVSGNQITHFNSTVGDSFLVNYTFDPTTDSLLLAENGYFLITESDDNLIT